MKPNLLIKMTTTGDKSKSETRIKLGKGLKNANVLTLINYTPL